MLSGFAVLAGTVRGNLTLLQAAAASDRWGSAAYGRLSAVLGAPATIAGALAPWATSTIASSLGYTSLFAALVGASALAVGLAAAAHTQAGTPGIRRA